ncbi:pre-rRNA processing [Conoideocrella luteorostrata]|uniref:Pre-rRNA processing n=1 Tax=Conoideocrella luteorostrata TaxID=1105319 RepID=A0AAJ0CX53_9HYPO|nr:pre-rRNA processing [Conoideocrella luteorostrata]
MADYDGVEATMSSENEHRLWTEMSECLVTDCTSHEAIDDALRTWLDITSQLRYRASDSQVDFLSCAHMLLESNIFKNNKDYVRTQIIHSLLQEDAAGPLHAIASLLFLDGCSDESTFPRMMEESCFARLLELIVARQDDPDSHLHRLLLQLMYEMSRVERLKVEDLTLVDDAFVHYLFGIIEEVSDDVQDPYHYPTIRVLLVLNEQYMLASTDTISDSTTTAPAALTNRIVKCLSLHGPLFRTFGENVILLLNRETETSLQLLILKLLYLLFTTKATYEYFYTNDLRVLLDVIIRNLMDLPDEKISLRHTYLRVMYPLLAHTQLNQPPHYKREEILRVLRILRGSHNAHFAPADETTLRLVDRVTKVQWVEDTEADKEGSGQAEVARKFLGISLSTLQCASSISVGDVAGVMERPGVQTPSRSATAAEAENDEDTSDNAPGSALKAKRPLPAVPKHRHGIPFTQLTKVHVNVNGEAKKVPPKAPPPRRWGRAKASEQLPIESIDRANPG